MKLNGKKINFLGDSITEGCGTSGKGHFFSDLIAADTGALCRNYGIGGTRIARQQKPSADPQAERTTSVTATHPSENSTTVRPTASAAL